MINKESADIKKEREKQTISIIQKYE